MNRRSFLCGLTLGTFCAPLVVEAQQSGKVNRVGVLTGASPSIMARYREVFHEALGVLGWTEGRNITVEWRFAEARYERLPELAGELVRLRPDVIVATNNSAIDAVKRVTSSVPIVMVYSSDPVHRRYIATLARPGANITGLTWDTDPKIAEKYVEFLREVVPGLLNIGGLIDPGLPGVEDYRRVGEAAASRLGLTFPHVVVQKSTDLENAFVEMSRRHVQAVMVYGGSLTFSHLSQIVDLTAKSRLPAIYVLREAVAVGGLMSYGVDQSVLFRRAAAYVDKILKGAKPADLPVEQPTRFELVVNLKTAKALGLTIPQSLLIRADEIIQ